MGGVCVAAAAGFSVQRGLACSSCTNSWPFPCTGCILEIAGKWGLLRRAVGCTGLLLCQLLLC